MASELMRTGRLEMHSFQGLVTGKICMAETTASALDVLNRMVLVTAGTGPRMRPSWLIRSANDEKPDNIRTPNSVKRDKCTISRGLAAIGAERKPEPENRWRKAEVGKRRGMIPCPPSGICPQASG